MRETAVSETLVHTQTMYECDVGDCHFSTMDEKEANHHVGRVHAAKANKVVAGIECFLFDSEADAKAHLAAQDADHRWPVTGVAWDGPGWYALNLYTGWFRGESETRARYRTIAAEIAARQEEIRELTAPLVELRALQRQHKRPTQ